MQDRHKLKTELFKEKPSYFMGCDTPPPTFQRRFINEKETFLPQA